VGETLVGGGDAEQGSECGMPGAPAVEAEDEFIEVALEVLTAQPVVDAQGPDLEVGEDPVNPGQDDMVLSALAPAGGYQSSWGTLLLLGGMKRDAVPGMSINGRQASV
jgi:hypothetical protein